LLKTSGKAVLLWLLGLKSDELGAGGDFRARLDTEIEVISGMWTYIAAIGLSSRQLRLDLDAILRCMLSKPLIHVHQGTG
jgi:hypothetical protein